MHRYIRIELALPEVTAPTSVAELEIIDSASARVLRLVELVDTEVTGYIDNGTVVGQPNQPLEVVPHPDTYATYTDITVTELTSAEFAALWEQAQYLFSPHSTDTGVSTRLH
ncbi:MAG: hypothetical protein SPI77_03675 [Corynebacterium sp.]|nr:hypothetical protein [Corynebacterium sp.]